MKLKLQDQSDNEHDFIISSDEITVREFKNQIENFLKTPSDEMRLVGPEGQLLAKDDAKLSTFNLSEGDLIYVRKKVNTRYFSNLSRQQELLESKLSTLSLTQSEPRSASTSAGSLVQSQSRRKQEPLSNINVIHQSTVPSEDESEGEGLKIPDILNFAQLNFEEGSEEALFFNELQMNTKEVFAEISEKNKMFEAKLRRMLKDKPQMHEALIRKVGKDQEATPVTPQNRLAPELPRVEHFDSENQDLRNFREFLVRLRQKTDIEQEALGFNPAHSRRAYSLTFYFILSASFLIKYENEIKASGIPLKINYELIKQQVFDPTQQIPLGPMKDYLNQCNFDCLIASDIKLDASEDVMDQGERAHSWKRAFEAITRFKHSDKSLPEEQVRVFWFDILKAFYTRNFSDEFVATLEYNILKVVKGFKSARSVDITIGLNETDFHNFFCEVAPTEMEEYDHKDAMKLPVCMSVILYAIYGICKEHNQLEVFKNIKLHGVFVGGSQFQFLQVYPLLTDSGFICIYQTTDHVKFYLDEIVPSCPINCPNCVHDQKRQMDVVGVVSQSQSIQNSVIDVESLEWGEQNPPPSPRLNHAKDFRNIPLTTLKTSLLQIEGGASLFFENSKYIDSIKGLLNSSLIKEYPNQIPTPPKSRTTHSSDTPGPLRPHGSEVPRQGGMNTRSKTNQHGFTFLVKEKCISEVEILQELSTSKFITTLFDYRYSSGEMMLVLEEFNEIDLAEWCQDEYPIRDFLPRTVLLMIDITGAIEFMQTQKIIHRNISFDSIVFSKRSGCFKLTDFACAVSYEQLPLRDEPLKKTPYIAPELLRGEEYDHGVDLYSLGMVIHIHFTEWISLYSIQISEIDQLAETIYQIVKKITEKKSKRMEIADVREQLMLFHEQIANFWFEEFGDFGYQRPPELEIGKAREELLKFEAGVGSAETVFVAET